MGCTASISRRVKFLYFQQCLYRRLSDYNLKDDYNTDVEFQEQFKLFSCLAFVHPDDVVSVHSLMMEKLITYDKLKNFNKEYFEATWVKNLKKSNQEPLFPISLWNVHER